MNISGTVIQETHQDVLKLTGCLAAIFKFISMTSIYFKYIMCCRGRRNRMLYLGKQSQWQQVLIQTKCPWRWRLIILYNNNDKVSATVFFFLLWVFHFLETAICHRPSVITDKARKG